jgi:homoserine O-acetyltransferase
MTNSRLHFHFPGPFELESGEQLPELTLAYHRFGTLNAAADNVVWICHALTGNANPMDWWPGLVGPGKLLDPDRHFIVCANMIGSCYGSTSPRSVNPLSGKPYGAEFPLISIRDMVQAQQALAQHLGIGRIHLLLGGSMGGQQALEWALLAPERVEHLVLLATNAVHSPWGIAFNEAQRMAIESDLSWTNDSPEAGASGLQAARALAMLSYRGYRTYGATQSELPTDKLSGFRAASYQRYQGQKLSERFHAQCYHSLSRSMDSHDLGRGRGGILQALGEIRARSLVIGIQSDILFPPSEQILLATHIPDARFHLLPSLYGHDGFLVETDTIAPLIGAFLRGRSTKQSLPAAMYGIPGTEAF